MPAGHASFTTNINNTNLSNTNSNNTNFNNTDLLQQQEKTVVAEQKKKLFFIKESLSDFEIKKDSSLSPPKYLVFFKGRDYLQVGNAMEIFRRNNVRFIAINNSIDSTEPSTLEFTPFINIMSEWYARDKKVKTGIKTKGTSEKLITTEAPYGYVKDPNNKDFWLIDKEAAKIVRLIFRLFMDGKN